MTHQYSGRILFTEIEKDVPNKGLELSTTLGCQQKAHRSSSSVVPVAACIYHTPAETCSSTDRRVRQKNNYSISRKPRQYSAAKLSHTHNVASCSAGGRQVCLALERAGCSTRPALLILCCLFSVAAGLHTHLTFIKLEK